MGFGATHKYSVKKLIDHKTTRIYMQSGWDSDIYHAMYARHDVIIESACLWLEGVIQFDSKRHLEELGVEVLGGGQAEAVDLHKVEGGQPPALGLGLSPNASHNVQHGRRLAGAGHPRHVQALPHALGACPRRQSSRVRTDTHSLGYW